MLKRLFLFLAIGLVLSLHSAATHLLRVVASLFNGGTILNRVQTKVGTRKKEDLPLMLQHTGTVRNISTGTIPTATSIKNPAEGFIFT